MKLRFELPSEKHKEIVLKYRQKFLDSGDSIDGSAGLSAAKTYEEWLAHNILNRDIATVESGFVPAKTFLVFDSEKSDELIGMIDIRLDLNDYLLKFGGNIGYSVSPEFRCMGYATSMLKKACKWCRDNKMKRVLVTCDQNNIASIKVIEKNRGILEDIIQNSGHYTMRYWIDVDQ